MNTQSSLWFVHSMQFFDWNGVHLRNMSPPDPCWPPPAPCQEPVRSGFPLASLGVGACAASCCAGVGACAWTATAVTKRLRITTIITDAFIGILTFHQPFVHCPELAQRR